jgi:nucleotide-binding universal stress UspA family protein
MARAMHLGPAAAGAMCAPRFLIIRRRRMKRILVPLDGSEFAEAALPTAQALSQRFGAELHLASVVSDLPPVPLASGDGELVSRWFEQEEERAKTYLDRSAEALAGTKVPPANRHVRSGPVARTIDAIAADVDADLVVLTTHGRGAWQRAWLGSVADALVRRTSRSLLLLREKRGTPVREGGIPSRALVPLDSSPAAAAGLEAALPLLEPGRTRVDLLMVIHEPFPLATTYLPHTISEGALLDERKKRAREYLEGIEERLDGEGVEAEITVHTAGDAGHGILEHAEKSGADLIAIASRGRGAAARMMLGSVADKVIRGARVPVLVAKRQDPD